jgi:hypothetical protein
MRIPALTSRLNTGNTSKPNRGQSPPRSAKSRRTAGRRAALAFTVETPILCIAKLMHGKPGERR